MPRVVSEFAFGLTEKEVVWLRWGCGGRGGDGRVMVGVGRGVGGDIGTRQGD